MAWRMASAITEWNAARSWVETPARILAVRLERHAGDGGDTLIATARYTYRFEGNRYEHDRVSLHEGSDNIGNFHQRVDAELRRFLQQEKPFRCFVNPRRPSEAVLYRDLRWELLSFEAMFGLVFGGVGGGMLVWSVYNRRQRQHAVVQRDRFPDEPWRCRTDWAEGRIRDDSMTGQLVAWALALLWNLISWAVAIAAYTGDQPLPAWVHALTIGFPLIGLGLLSYAVALTLRHLRWGRSEFQLATVPGVIGGRLAGVIRLSRAINPPDGFLVALTHYQARHNETADGTETYLEPLWQIEKRITRPLRDEQGRGLAVPVEFWIPFDQPPSDPDQGQSWRLEARAEVPGIDYHAEFEVPVFRTSDSSSEPPDDQTALDAYTEPERLVTLVRRCGGRLVEETPTHCTIVFPMGRNPLMALAVTCGTLFFGAAAIGLWLEDAWLLGTVFSFVVAGLAYGTCWLWLERITLEFGSEGVAIQGGLCGWGRRRFFAAERILRVEARASGERSGRVVFQEVVLQATGERKCKLVGRIPRRAHAERLATKIRAMLPTPSTGS